MVAPGLLSVLRAVCNRISWIGEVKGGTVGYVNIEPMGYELFFAPRVRGREYYKSDEGARVKFLVAFTYEKPRAFDVTRISSDGQELEN